MLVNDQWWRVLHPNGGTKARAGCGDISWSHAGLHSHCPQHLISFGWEIPGLHQENISMPEKIKVSVMDNLN